jgi:spermidine synthase
VIPWTLIDSGAVPGSEVPLKLMRRGEEYAIRLGANELMNTRLSGSEEALATEALRAGTPAVAGRRSPRVLIGGLGLGFTLRAALGVLPATAQVTVAELVPQVIAWARGPLAHVFAGSVEDPRVTLRAADVAEVIAAARGGFDAILLDVDNGPDGLTADANDRLYSAGGLATARVALAAGGVLAVWSAHPDPAFARRFGKAGFAVAEITVRAHRGHGGARHTIWIGTRR